MPAEKLKAVFVTCGTNISCKGRSAGGMKNHLYLKHKIQIDAKKTKPHVPSLATVSSAGKNRIDSCFRPKNSCQVLYEALLTIQPTSAEAERAFNACGFIATKLRSRIKRFNNRCVVLYSKCVAGKINITNLCFFVVLYKVS